MRFNRQIRKIPLCKGIMSADIDLIFLRAKRRMIEDENWGATGLPFFEFVDSLFLVIEKAFNITFSNTGNSTMEYENGHEDEAIDSRDGETSSCTKNGKHVLGYMKMFCEQIKEEFKVE
jgi:hypothetical protein